MTVWVTRSEPGATRLAGALRAAGHEVLKAPVLEVRPQPFGPVQGPFDLGLFLSVHGVRIAAAELGGAARAVFAVGRRTRSALRAQGFDADVPGIETTEGLLDALGDVAGKRILIVTGAGGRTLLADALRSRGAGVTRLDVYLRYPLLPEVDTGTVNVIVASSGDGLRQVERVWAACAGDAGTPVLTPSARVAALGAELGFRSVHDCGGADPQAVLRALGQIGFESSPAR